MRIKTQFFITMAVFGVMLAVIGTSLAVTMREMSHLDREEEIAANIGRDARELSYLSGDYLLYGEEQQRTRWLSKWDAATENVARLSPATAEERVIRDHLAANLARLKAVFEDASQAPGDTTTSGGGIASVAHFQVSWSRLAVQSQGTAFEALKLSSALREQRALVSQRNTILIAVMLVVFAVYFAANYRIVYRRALRDVGQLRAGTKIVGSGDLDYAIPVTRNDEIGELSRAFNRMTTDLKGVTASKAQLEREAAEREKAEVALRHSLERIEVLSDARERELETTKRLLGAAEALAEWTDLDHALEGLADIVLASTEHTRVAVHMWDSTKRVLQATVVRGDVSSFPIGEALGWEELSEPAQDIMETMRSRVIDYDALPKEQRARVAPTGARLGLAVPLVYRQRLVGLVFVDDPGERREFEDREIALISGIAAQAAVVIENARHYDEERTVADALRSVFQRPVPDIAGIDLGVVGHYASQTERVGGDFYDAFAIDGEVVVLIGDVAGKGLSAVGLTERVRSAIRTLSYAGESLSPSYLLSRTNESLVQQIAPEEFATAVLLTIDTESGAYRIARAGHPLPVVCGDTCGYIETPSGAPLGVVEGEYEELTGVLAAGETIVLYTDGVTEARRGGDFYGDRRLLDAISGHSLEPERIAEELFTDVEEFARGNLADDLLIVALRLSPTAGS
ncbi:MAG: SpoIIE family protein phosphatase [Coriobacteriia bacterium]